MTGHCGKWNWDCPQITWKTQNWAVAGSCDLPEKCRLDFLSRSFPHLIRSQQVEQSREYDVTRWDGQRRGKLTKEEAGRLLVGENTFGIGHILR